MASFFQSLLRLTRFTNLLIIGLAQYFTAYFLVDATTLTDIRLLILTSSTVLIAAAGYIINDYYDIKIDYINKPERVIIGKAIPRRFAILFHTLFSFAGIALGYYLGWQIALINFLSAFLLWWYSNNLKRLPFVGNFSIALLTGTSIYMVALLFGGDDTLIIIYSSFAFFMTLVREIIKDMEDLKGDSTFGCKTLPIVWGFRKTKQFLYAVVFIFCMTVLILDLLFTALPSVYFVLFLFAPLVWMVLRLYRADTVKEFEWISTFCKVIMLLGILSMSLL
ncbi:prenyltransferase [Chryseotalea sanaruensis]|uniref:Prenyltransferase n=1 Tax=Chryseotalea sanaruensis TaxID=2482724 RepID=A0A401UC20_9BACT|nr:geranylgeranylglycerol-phosphate geranylgeranyltransferase [Chryseotalea sanaruensis]GCC52414.1 prenyltransferase [Chryseotalea sanaruensis]